MSAPQKPKRREWPRYAVSPTGQRARIDCIGDMHVGWRLEIPMTSAPVQLVEPAAPEPPAAKPARKKAAAGG